ncbi:MAG: hypothetical protein LBN03_00795 [Bifidobacteriaceae bacterium]|jgi:N utilization substance protein A|nr:hypothetical protein [Bifidobacteriaceae bacterium]
MDINVQKVEAVAKELGLDTDDLFGPIKETLLVAYFKHMDIQRRDPEARNYSVDINDKTGAIQIFKKVGRDQFDDVTPENFGRSTEGLVKDIILRKIKHVEDEKKLGKFAKAKGTIIAATVIKDPKEEADGNTRPLHLDIGETFYAVMPLSDTIPGEEYHNGKVLKVYVTDVRMVENERGKRFPRVTVSRAHPKLVQRLFESVVPELTEEIDLNGNPVTPGSYDIEGAEEFETLTRASIVSISREAGSRCKVAVRANLDGFNATGALIGEMGSRVRSVMESIGGEKIDIILYDTEIEKFIANSLSPSQVQNVKVLDRDAKKAVATVPDFQLSLAIGVDGQNVRLANKLTMWSIDIVSDK